MSTPSSSIVGKWKSSGGCEFTYENIFWHETPCFRFFQVLLWPLGSRKYGLCFRGFGTRSGKLSTKGAWAHIWKIRSEKGARDCSDSSISHTNGKKLRGPERFWKIIVVQIYHKFASLWRTTRRKKRADPRMRVSGTLALVVRTGLCFLPFGLVGKRWTRL